MDVLRSVSIWSVLLTHIWYWFDHTPGDNLGRFIRPLLLGVEPFFVLGGFLAAQTFHRLGQKRGLGFQQVKSYWYRRWMRTIPNYFLFLALNYIAFSIFRQGFQFDLKYLVFMQNFYWLTPQFFSVSWSLATQEWFYLLFPLTLFVVMIPFGQKGLYVAVFFFIFASFGFRANYIFTYNPESLEGFLRRVALLRMDSVVVGVIVGWEYFKGLRNSTIHLLLRIGTVGVFSLLFIRHFSDAASMPAVQVLYYPLFSLMLAFTMPFIYEIKKVSIRMVDLIFEKTSKWSYSIYLSHVFIMDAIFLILQKFQLTENLPFLLFSALTWLTATYGSSAILYNKFELKIMFMLKPSHRRDTLADYRSEN